MFLQTSLARNVAVGLAHPEEVETELFDISRGREPQVLHVAHGFVNLNPKSELCVSTQTGI